MKLLLGKYNWFRGYKISVTGFILENNRRISGESLAHYFSGLNSVNDFRNQLIGANGQFSVIIERENETWAACDRLRNLPLFYRIDGSSCSLSDNAYSCLKKGDSIDEMMAGAFQGAGFVPGINTLVKQISQIEAGSYVIFSEKIKAAFYHSIIDTRVTGYDWFSAAGKLKDTIENVFSNHLAALNDKFIAVSLSGGYDSRLLALMASRYHPKNLIFFTYGRPGNREAAKACKVASGLDVKWINIEYDNEMIKDFVKDPVFNEYYPYASALVSMLYLSDYFAVKHLRENNLVPENCVFLPGHTGDVLAGSHLLPGLNRPLSDNKMTDIIFSAYFRYCNSDRDAKQTVSELIKEKIQAGSSNAWQILENWEMKERQAKFIVNSSHVYTFFGYDYDLPFWDRSMIDFFSSLPFEMKKGKVLYDHVLKNAFFSDSGLCFDDDTHVTSAQKRYQKIKDHIKPFLPYTLVSALSDQKSIIFYDEITKLLRDDMGENNVIRPKQANYYNSYIIQWYLYKTGMMLSREKAAS